MKKVWRMLGLLLGAVVVVFLEACTEDFIYRAPQKTEPPVTDPGPALEEIAISFVAASSEDWKLESVLGPLTTVPAGELDPTIALEVGKRYQIINKGGAAHPFAIVSQDASTLLLSEWGIGTFEQNPTINFVKNSDGFTFTLTGELAAQMASYVCTYHADMAGIITVTGL
ncbi:MAG: cupredoxin domain-containing protein [Trueperaceae bacterium]